MPEFGRLSDLNRMGSLQCAERWVFGGYIGIFTSTCCWQLGYKAEKDRDGGRGRERKREIQILGVSAVDRFKALLKEDF